MAFLLGRSFRLGRALISLGFAAGPADANPVVIVGCGHVTFEPTAIASCGFEPTAIATVTFAGC